MTQPSRPRRTFVAVQVHCGVIYDVRAFQEGESALRCAQNWRRSANEEDDDIQVREVFIRA